MGVSQVILFLWKGEGEKVGFETAGRTGKEMTEVMPLVLDIDYDYDDVDESEYGVRCDRFTPVEESLQRSVFNATALLFPEDLKSTSKLATPLECLPGLFLGNRKNREIASKLGITYVLNLAAKSASMDYESGMTVLSIPAEDRRGFRILERYLEKCHRFIKEGLRDGGKVLVHCDAGINRSAVIVAAYMLLEGSRTFSNILSFLKDHRGVVLTNTCFVVELVSLAKSLDLLDL